MGDLQPERAFEDLRTLVDAGAMQSTHDEDLTVVHTNNTDNPARTDQPTGIYAAIYVEPIGRHKKFFDQFNSRILRENLSEGNMHVTAQYPREIIDQGIEVATYDLVAVASGLVTTRLGQLGLFDVEFHVDTERGIQGKKKWWTVEVAEDDEELFNQCRDVAATAVEETIPGVSIAHTSPEGYHASVVHRGKSNHSRMRAKIAPPLRWRITGVGVIQSIITNRDAAVDQASRNVKGGGSSPNSYVNRPRVLQTNHAVRK